jgi:excisionase family DNA binding protein
MPGSIRRLTGTDDSRSVLIDQAMEMLGVCRRTVYYWIRQGRLRTIRTRGGSQRVLISSICSLTGSHASAVRPSSSASHAESSGVLNSLST